MYSDDYMLKVMDHSKNHHHYHSSLHYIIIIIIIIIIGVRNGIMFTKYRSIYNIGLQYDLSQYASNDDELNSASDE
jgi:hypothetical protein